MTVVYTLPSCVQCRATKRHLEKKGIPYIEADARLPENRDRIAAWGYTQAPVVESGSDHWSGYDPDRLNSL